MFPAVRSLCGLDLYSIRVLVERLGGEKGNNADMAKIHCSQGSSVDQISKVMDYVFCDGTSCICSHIILLSGQFILQNAASPNWDTTDGILTSPDSSSVLQLFTTCSFLVGFALSRLLTGSFSLFVLNCAHVRFPDVLRILRGKKQNFVDLTQSFKGNQSKRKQKQG